MATRVTAKARPTKPFIQPGDDRGSEHLDKAPDAFRTISEVADDLDIPQHVLRFWETRFTQIRPMKRSGGRRYYRPDDVDLLRGIHRLLYGEGYTIRGVQRILKEHGIGSVQRLADASAVASFGAIEEVIGQSILEQEDDAAASLDLDDDDFDGLKTALQDLIACRQLLDSALREG